MRLLRVGVVAVVLSSLASSASGQEVFSADFEAPMTAADRWDPRLGRACRGDLFTFSLPVGMGGVGLSEVDRRTIADDIARIGVAAFSGEAVEPRWGRVLPGDDRYWALAFVRTRTNADGDDVEERLRIRPGQVCGLLNTMRGALRAQLGERGDDWAISRECDVVGQGAGPTTWYDDALFPRPLGVFALPDDQANADAFEPWGGFWFAPPATTVGLVDGPMSVAARSHVLGVPDWTTAPLTRVDGAHQDVTYLHADAMAWLIRRVAPDAHIRTYQALHANSTGTPISAVAGALKRAVDDRVDLINLSLGWPPEMGRPARVVDGDGCEAIEDPAGEAVRAVLAEAHIRSIPVIAAAGNRVGPMPSTHLGTYDDRRSESVFERQFPCIAGGWSAQAAARDVGPLRADLFYPAAWSEIPTCIPSGKSTRLGPMRIQPVAAYGKRGQRVLGGGTLAAPGIDVELIDAPPGLPRAMTGTSVAAALTSGLIALRAAETGRTATEVADGIFDETVSCLSIGPQSLLRSCPDAVLEQRRPRAFGSVPFKDEDEAPEDEAVDPFEAFFLDFEAQFGPPAVLQVVDSAWTTGDAFSNDDPSGLDRFAAGGLGPQPEIDPCDDDCFFLAERGANGSAALDLRMRFDRTDIRVAHVGIEMKTDIVQAIKLPTSVRDAINGQLEDDKSKRGVVELIVSGVPLPGAFGKRATLWLVYDLDDGSKQITRRRSRLEPAYKLDDRRDVPVLQFGF